MTGVQNLKNGWCDPDHAHVIQRLIDIAYVSKIMASLASAFQESWRKTQNVTKSTRTVYTSAKARLTSVAIRIRNPYANLPWKFHANPFGSFCAKLLTKRQTGKQINKQRRFHTCVGRGKNRGNLWWSGSLKVIGDVSSQISAYTTFHSPFIEIMRL